MTSNTTQEIPKTMMSRALWAADNTPAKRNRAVDFYRALAIFCVILGHWFLIAPVLRSGEVTLAVILAEQPWTQYLTWLFQVMPVFFFVGGFSNALSWNSARNDPEKHRVWASGRLARLLKPTIPLTIVWALGAFIAARMGVATDLIIVTSQAALVPIWFLAVYIVITMVVPISFAVWEKIGIWSVVLLAVGAILVDGIAFGLDQGWIRWANYGFIWLAVHQLGYWWQTASHPRNAGLALVTLGIIGLYLLIAHLGYPVAMVSVPGEEISNTRPPTIAMLAVASMQIGVILVITASIAKWLQRRRPWAIVILMNQMIMTIYLWHMTALLVIVGIALALGGLGLSIEPSTGLWWMLRPVWLVFYLLALTILVMIFVRFESGTKGGPEKTPGPLQSVPGAFVACGGLIMMALTGVGANTALGVNWIAIGLVLGGVLLSTRRLF